MNVDEGRDPRARQLGAVSDGQLGALAGIAYILGVVLLRRRS